MPSPYRSDIDGLRAISALSVVFFHAGVPGFRGGFLGVDVFFVISGYLITQVLMTPGEQSLWRQLAQFYLRRCRRILPALFALLFVVTPIAAAMLRPADLRNYGRYLTFTSLFLTNVAAWTDHVRGWTPLIHLWSIGVEEQFYLVYPLALGLAVGARSVCIILLAAMASFALCVWASYAAPLANFYLTPSRAWELLCGAALALSAARIRSRISSELLAWISVLVIGVAIYAYSPATRYPGICAMPVCVAAGALLATGHDQKTTVARLLSFPPLVLTGLISYSLYLWHVPIFALLYYRTGGSANGLHTALLICAIWLLAFASWAMVERPIRSRRWLGSNRRFLIAAVVANVLLGCAGLFLWWARILQ
jgi:peptidoglycan/LPS O-acetylase OafA/YrhL